MSAEYLSYADSFSTVSRSEKHINVGTRYRWTSYWEYIASALICLFSITHYDGVCKLGSPTEPSLLQLFVSHVLIGLPLYYMQIVLGKYTQMGIILLKYLSPIGQGVGFGFTVVLFLNSIKNGLLLSHYMIYLLTSMQSQLQYLTCPPNSARRCWSRVSNCTDQCINDKISMSAWLYFREVFMKSRAPYIDKVAFGIPSASKIVLIFSTWSVTGVLLICVAKNYRRCTFTIYSVTLILVGLLLSNSVLSSQQLALVSLFTTEVPVLSSGDNWYSAISITISQMCLGRAFHVIHGSYMDPKWPSALLAMSVMLLNFILITICSLVTQTSVEMVRSNAHLENGQSYEALTRGLPLFFGVIPQGLDSDKMPQFWCTIYFASGVLILLNNQLVHIVAIDTTLHDSFPVLIRYKNYVITVTCIVGCIFGVVLSAKESAYITRILMLKIIQQTEVFNTLMLSILVSWIYGVRKFCDDIHFMYGSQPTKFWKFLWYASPFFVALSHTYVIYIYPMEFDDDCLLVWFCYWVLITPAPIFAFVAIFRFMKQRNLVGLFQSNELFGPPDPDERLLRRIYNPRREIRSRRRNEVCHHNCIVDNKVLKKVLHDETMFKKGLAEEYSI